VAELVDAGDSKSNRLTSMQNTVGPFFY